MRVRLLGGLEAATKDGALVRFGTRKSSLLFATLVLGGSGGYRREQLCDAFWPGRGDPQARNSLRQSLADIRKWFPADGDADIYVEANQERVALIARADEADVWLFERKIAEGEIKDLAFAADLYRGDVLARDTIPDGLEEWFGPYQNKYRQNALQLVEQLSLELSGVDPAYVVACERLAERLLTSDPTAEPAHRALMRVYADRGQENAALRQFESCRAALKKYLDVEPEEQTNSLLVSLQSRERGEIRRAVKTQQGQSQPKANPILTRPHDQPSVAVLPFDNLGGTDNEYFADGVVEEIIAALSRVRDFIVIARQSSFTYKGRFVDVREVGQQLGVNYVVEGTVRQGGDRLRISVQLIDADTRAQIWSDRYEGTLQDVFEFQDRIAAQVAGAIRPAIRNAEISLSKRKQPDNLRAYDLVLRAFPNLWGRRKDDNRKAIELLREAVHIDPTYGRAHALLAWCHAHNASYLWTDDPKRDLEMALDSVAAAGRIDDDPTALASAGAALSICGEQERAAALVEKALALDPNNAWAWARYGWIGVYRGEPGLAMERFQKAMSLSPMDPYIFNMRIGTAASMAMAGALPEAIEIGRDVVYGHPDVTLVYRHLAAWSGIAGDLETARWAGEKLLETQPDFTIERYRLLPMFRLHPNWAEQMFEGLRAAGLPER